MPRSNREPQQGKRRHRVMTAEIRKQLPKLYTQENRGGESLAVLKVFSPLTRFRFYALEFDGVDTLFGFTVSALGPDCDELGYASLNKLLTMERLGMPLIERDTSWQPTKTNQIKEWKEWSAKHLQTTVVDDEWVNAR